MESERERSSQSWPPRRGWREMPTRRGRRGGAPSTPRSHLLEFLRCCNHTTFLRKWIMDYTLARL
eukprot:scaffold246238_cov38-Tisochrysis_lutea.AAC.5